MRPLTPREAAIYWVYILRSDRDPRLYTGVTSDLPRRLREHNAGKVRSTRARRPLSLEYTEVYRTKNEALARETYFKTPEGGALKQHLAAQVKADDKLSAP